MKISIINDDGAVFLLDVSEQFDTRGGVWDPCGEIALVYNMAIKC